MIHTASPLATRPSSRRRFLQNSSATVLAGASSLNRFLSRSAYAAGNDLLRVGLIGCGSRGTGAAAEALKADENVKLVTRKT